MQRASMILRIQKQLSLAAAVLVLTAGACSGGVPEQPGTAAPPAAQQLSQPLIFTLPDVVLSRAENTTGWTAGGNTLARDQTARQDGISSLRSIGTGQDRFRNDALTPLDVRSMSYLTFWYYIDDASKIRKDRDAQIEISSHGSLDTEEMNWDLHKQHLVSGWNFIRLELPGALSSLTGNRINLAAVKRFRLYHFVSASVTTRIDNIRFTNREDELVEATCASDAAVVAITSVGQTRSGTSYGTATCNKGYVVDVNRYAPPDRTGTVVAYSGPNTNDAAVCASTRVEANVFRRTPGSTSYAPLLNRRGFVGATKNGRMGVTTSGARICQRPHLVLDLEFPDYLAGADYRLVIRSERIVDGTREFRETTLVTPQPSDTPSSELAEMRRLPNAFVMASLLLRAKSVSAESRALGCRTSLVTLKLLERVAPALTALGVTTNTAEGYAPAVRSVHEAFCGSAFGTSGFDAAFRAAVRTLATRHTEIVDQAAAHLAADHEVAAGLVDRFLSDVSLDMMRECAAESSALAGFLFGGNALGAPLEDAVEDNLFVACSGSGAATRASERGRAVAQALASGTGLAGTFRRCINDVMSKEFRNECSDPRADVETGLPAQTIERCMQLETPDAQDGCIRAAQEWKEHRDDVEEEEAGEPVDGYASCQGLKDIELVLCEDAQTRLDSAAVPGAQEIQRTRGFADAAGGGGFWTAVKTFFRVVTKPFLPPMNLSLAEIPLRAGAGALQGVTRVQEGELRKLCNIRPTHDKCQDLEILDRNTERCLGETFGDRSVSYPVSDGGESAMTVFDRMDGCYCEYLGRPVFGQDCMSADERRRQDCLSNPWGNNDGPRPECLRYLRDVSGLDVSALLGSMCEYERPNCDGASYIEADDTCGCWRVNVDSDPQALCQNANAINCGPDSIFDQRSCGCQPFDSGKNPWGNDPLCRNDPRFSPGGRDGFITLNPNDLLTNRFYDLEGHDSIDFHMVRAGGLVPVAGPALYTNAFENLGNRLELEIKMPNAVGPSGYRGAAQVYCTSENVKNRLLDQRELAGLELGGIHTLGFELTPEDLELCAGTDGAWRFEFAINSDARTVQRVGIGDVRFAGNVVPVDSPLNRCPTPDPGPDLAPFTPPILVHPELLDAIAIPSIWTFSNGAVTTLDDPFPR
jgi:hypothetical protein